MTAWIRSTLAFVMVSGTAPASAQTWVGERDAPNPIGFGAAVALRGAELYVGRVGLVAGFPMPSAQSGAVYLFRRGADGTWAETGSLQPTDSEIGDGFGASIALSGERLAVGASQRSGGGAVYVFERSGGQWRQVARLTLPDAGAQDEFGHRVALDGDLLVVGVPGRDSARGSVYAFRRNAQGAWSAPVVVARGAEPSDRMGTAVALSGGKVLAGAPGPMGGGNPFGQGAAPRSGTAAVYAAGPGGAWRLEASLVPGPDTTVAHGTAVLFSGTEAVVAAPGTASGTGRVYVFRRDGDRWAVAARIAAATPQAGTLLGMALARDGNTLLVGAPMAGGGVGAVHVFGLAGDAWTERQRLTVPGVGLGVQFGAAIGLDGNHAVIGGPFGDFFEGSGYGYTRDAAGEWKETGRVADRPEVLAAITGGERRCDTGRIEVFACQEVDLLSFLSPSALGAARGIMVNDIWGWTHAESRREFALVGRMDGTSFVEVTDPTNPVFLGDLPLTPGARPNLWRDLKVYRDHVYIVADNAGQHGVQVFDLTRLLSVRGAPQTFTADVVYDRIASAHNIAINEESGFAYTIGNSGGGETCGGALHMIDIREPKSPQFAGCFADPATGMQRTGYTHDNQCVMYQGPDTRYRGREICFNASETAVGIADVTDKAAPRAIAVASYPNTAYAHQGWLTEDHRYFYLNDEGDELSGTVDRTRTLVWDVQKLDEPVLVKEFLGTTAATDHNLYIRGNYMFQSNYVAGLRVIDISEPVNPRETGYFDTVPWGENTPGFAGSWSNYPFFPSGTIVVTSMREGLFVLRHRPSRPLVP